MSRLKRVRTYFDNSDVLQQAVRILAAEVADFTSSFHFVACFCGLFGLSNTRNCVHGISTDAVTGYATLLLVASVNCLGLQRSSLGTKCMSLA